MRERPILFAGPMVRAILNGEKTVTRRVMKPFQVPTLDDDGRWYSVAQRDPKWGFAVDGDTERECANALAASLCCPHGAPGDRLWVRETYGDAGCRLTYRADLDDGAHCMVKKWIPSIHMPRSASRILLKITAVRIERLQDISDEQALAEGVGVTKHAVGVKLTSPHDESVPRAMFRELWQSINGTESWTANPWVWVVEFKRITA
ncbi:ASCH domain-containing protein [Metapseudomonas otitidis]|uniref:hypothetical protein n=1 Tax=Metapseudomonas otitidis TaxID=319939 RepID=UPI001CA3D8F2|nr:hypothetical protein [Pseudomonas otitidis]QZX85311.1 hypothetical protein K6751_11610 [Pseudomonas otitidis]